jgi:hypothetical protein
MKRFFNTVIIIITTVLLYSFSSIYASSQDPWKYEIEAINTGVSGTYLVKVWVYLKKSDVDYDLVKKMAIHGVIFKGVSGNDLFPPQPPLSNDPSIEDNQKEFFNIFFSNNGDYSKFINSSSDQVAPGDRMKIGREFKIGVILSVNKDALRTHLENSGIIRKLSEGF